MLARAVAARCKTPDALAGVGRFRPTSDLRRRLDAETSLFSEMIPRSRCRRIVPLAGSRAAARRAQNVVEVLEVAAGV